MVFPPADVQIAHPDAVEDDSEADVEDEEDDYDGGDDGDDDGGQKGTEEDCGHPDSSGHCSNTDQEKQNRAVSDVDFQKLVLQTSLKNFHHGLVIGLVPNRHFYGYKLG